MSNGRPILILAASTGAGHLIAARAVEAALRSLAPALRVEVHDVLASAGPFFRRFYGGGYAGMVRRFPTAMGWLYDQMDHLARPGHDRVRRSIQGLFTGAIARHIVGRQPKLIINTHFLSAEIAAQLRRRGRLSCPQVTVTTDFETHRLWVHTPTERYYTATELGRAYLAMWGVPPERVLVTGIPVRLAFEQPTERAAARAALGLQMDRPAVLLLGGVLGLETTHELLTELLRMPADAQIVVVAGRNERLRRRLEEQAAAAPRRVYVIGFTEQMHEYMRAADLVITKPGGLTSSEALVSGLPLVIVNPIPGQETRNSDYLLEHGAAIKVNNPRLLGHRVSEILSQPARLEALRDAALRLAKPGAAATIARDALELLRNWPGCVRATDDGHSYSAPTTCVSGSPAVEPGCPDPRS